MEWMAIIGDSVQYIEDHITEDISAENIAKAVGVSPFYFQKGFAMLCGFSVAEYIRNRRLALSGNDLLITDDKVIDIAMKYGYDSPDSFTKAFTRFHGVSPSSVRKDEVLLKTFAPLKVNYSAIELPEHLICANFVCVDSGCVHNTFTAFYTATFFISGFCILSASSFLLLFSS